MSTLTEASHNFSDSKRKKEDHIEYVKAYTQRASSRIDTPLKKDMISLYRAYLAELSEEEEAMAKSITCPHGIDLGVEYIVYPLIQSKTEQIVGEFMLRPIKRKAFVVDKTSKNEKYEEKLRMLGEEIMRELAAEMETDLGFLPETENPEMEIPEDIDSFFENDFKTLAEEVADGLMTVFLDVRKEKNKLRDLFTDYAIVDRCHAVLDKENGHTTMRKVHPLDCDYDIDPYKIVQDNHEYFIESYWMTELEIYNTFSLTKKQKNKVRAMFEGMNNIPEENDIGSDEISRTKVGNEWYDASTKINRLRVVHAMWKAERNISLKISKGKNDQEFVKEVDDNYKERKNDVIERIEGDEPRFIYMIGPDVVLDWGLMEQRYSFNETPWECVLPVISLIRENTIGSGKIKSIAAKLRQLQNLASEVLFEIRLAIKHIGDSRVLVYDSAQTPKEFSKGGYEAGLNRVMHHVKKDKFMVINSKEKGASKNTFNQFTSLDLSSRGAIQDLFNGLAVIEDLASKFTGISPEREGQVGQYQTATGTDKAIRGSTARTEVLFTPFDEFIQALLEKVLLKAKQDYERGEVLHFIFGKMKTKFLKLFDDFFFSDLGVYLSNPGKDLEVAQRIDAAAELALSNSQDPRMVLGMIDVFEGDNASEKKKIFEKMIDSMEKLREEAIQRDQEANQIAAQQEEEERKNQAQLIREGHHKDIQVADIYARNKSNVERLKTLSNERIKAAEMAENIDQQEMEQENMENQMQNQPQPQPETTEV